MIKIKKTSQFQIEFETMHLFHKFTLLIAKAMALGASGHRIKQPNKFVPNAI